MPNVSVPANTWTQLTPTNVTALRVENESGYAVQLQATVGAVAPTSFDAVVTLHPFIPWAADLGIAQLFPGVAGANRIWAYCITPVVLSVSQS